MMRAWLLAAGLVLLAVVGAIVWQMRSAPGWSETERQAIAALSLSALPTLPPDPSNRVADDPRAVELGEALFSDPRLSASGTVACASCHQPDRQFQDDALPGETVGHTVRRTMPLRGASYSPWFFWDGLADSQWAQALGPLENPDEHASDRLAYAHLVAEAYPEAYEALFGPLPDLAGLPEHGAPVGAPEIVSAWLEIAEDRRAGVDAVFANLGKALAAYQRTLMPERTRFDDYADAIAAGESGEGLLSAAEIAGLRLFIGVGDCTQCHNGPLLSNHHFHNTGVPEAPGLPQDLGRYGALAAVRADPFNCLGAYSDAEPADCAELRFMATGREMIRAFKVPSLRGVADRPPYMHAGQFASLAEVVAHYNRAPWAPIGVSELHPLALSETDLDNLVAFLQAL